MLIFLFLWIIADNIIRFLLFLVDIILIASRNRFHQPTAIVRYLSLFSPVTISLLVLRINFHFACCPVFRFSVHRFYLISTHITILSIGLLRISLILWIVQIVVIYVSLPLCLILISIIHYQTST